VSALAAATDQHPIQWVTATPLWQAAAGAGLAEPTPAQRLAMQRPALLRFESDRFMEELAALLEHDPSALVAHAARPRSYRVRPPGESDEWEPAGARPQLKLYQPSQGHFNLVAASLVCQLPGLPDRGVDPARGDRVAFVLRRLHAGGELAWVSDPLAPDVHAWAAVPAGAREAVAPGEQLLPLFGVGSEGADPREHRRRVFVGLIPTSSRETYKNAGPVALPVPPRTGPDRRMIVLQAKVLDPLDALAAPSVRATDAALASPFVALELAEFLVENLPGWRRLLEGAGPDATAAQLFAWLSTRTADVGRRLSWLHVLRTVWSARRAICGEEPGTVPALDLRRADRGVGGAVSQALPVPAPTPSGGPSAPDPAAQPLPQISPGEDVRYVLRCVYQRPQCGPLHDDVVSAPSADFAIASFFDFDAPQRPIQISMPLDTSPAALRKYRKNVTFLLSDQLKQQMGRLNDLRSMSEGTFRDGSLDIGLICSFSIPIITICALLVLMIFISLLNIIFWWLPLFRICLPLGLKARSS
jgi:hypothetical protein